MAESGADMDGAYTLPPGHRLGDYEIVRGLGMGAMGAVYEARHAKLGKRVALKCLHPHVAAKGAVAERFLREAQAAARLRHPNVVDVSDIGSAGGLHYMVMEYLDGETLSSVFARESPLGAARALALMLPVLDAVAAAHDEGIVHRDLKPDNIFVARLKNNTECPKVLDFGVSKVSSPADGRAMTATDAILGTPLYMSPEQVRNSKHVDGRSDQYALSVMLYQGLSGRRPFDGESLLDLFQRIVAGGAPPLATLRPDLPPAIAYAVMRAMSVDPAARFASVRELAAALGAALQRASWAPAPQPVPDRPSTPTLPFGQGSLPEGAGTLDATIRGVESRPADAPQPTRRAGRRGLAIALGAFATLTLVVSAALLATRHRPTPAARPASAPDRATPRAEAATLARAPTAPRGAPSAPRSPAAPTTRQTLATAVAPSSSATAPRPAARGGARSRRRPDEAIPPSQTIYQVPPSAPAPANPLHLNL